MKAWLLVVAATGCGRLAFDELSDSGSGSCPGKFRSVAAGRWHTCAVDGAGAVWCWGNNGAGRVSLGAPAFVTSPITIALPSPAAQVVTGREHSCARLTDGTVWCWGSNVAEQLGTAGATATGAPVQVALGADRAVDLAAGAWHTCIVREADRSVVCWGDNPYFTLGVPAPMKSGTPIVIAGTAGTKQLSAGHRHNCIVDALDRVQCWGKNQQFQLGSTGPDREALAVVPSLAAAGDVSIAGAFSCALEQSGAARCWGRGDGGQLGPGQATTTPTPGPPIITDAIAIEPAAFGACAIHTDRSVGCWGKVWAGDGGIAYSGTVRPSHAVDVSQLSGPFFHMCAIAGGNVQCWGGNGDGELGRGTRAFSSSPVPISLPGSVTQLLTSRFHACASVGTALYCWGQNAEGQLGVPEFRSFASPVQSPVGLAVIDGLTANTQNTCAWGGGTLKCVGIGNEGQLGDGTFNDSSVWVTVGLANVTDAAMGRTSGCAVTGGEVWCWGSDASGQLGNGATTTTDQANPVRATGIAAATVVAAGKAHTCAIDAGIVKCWGYNGYGNLGDGTTTNRNNPVTVTLPATAQALSLGDMSSCALLANGDVYCWGYNVEGDLGTGNVSVLEAVPVRAQLPAAAAQITQGGVGGCARLVTGVTYCWGLGGHGELADGSERDVLLPEPIANLAGADDVDRTITGGCELRSGQVSCWGTRLLLANGDSSEDEPISPVFPGCAK